MSGDGLALLDLLARGAIREMACGLEVQRQRGEMMAEKVVEIASDAQALRGAAADVEQTAGHLQLRVRLGELLPRVGLAVCDVHRVRGEEEECEVGGGDGQRRLSFGTHDDAEDHGLRHADGDGGAERVFAELSGDDDQQHWGQVARAQRGADQGGPGLQRQERDLLDSIASSAAAEEKEDEKGCESGDDADGARRGGAVALDLAGNRRSGDDQPRDHADPDQISFFAQHQK